jgi:hypothetical protein
MRCPGLRHADVSWWRRGHSPGSDHGGSCTCRIAAGDSLLAERRERGVLEPDPVTAPVVSWMFGQRLAGHSAARITRALNDAGVPCPSAADPGRNLHRAGAGWTLRTVAWRLGTRRVEAEPETVAELIGLCARLPLALAITAARATARPEHPLAALAAELRAADGPLDALDVGEPTASVRSVFSWSYRQLSAAAARLFRLLGIHPGPDSRRRLPPPGPRGAGPGGAPAVGARPRSPDRRARPRPLCLP